MTPRTFHYVRHADIPQWEALGWMNTGSLSGCHHGAHADLFEWAGEGEPQYPIRGSQIVNDILYGVNE